MELSTPPPGAKDMYFHTKYSQATWGQLWEQWWIYWRSPDYNIFRYFFTLVAALSGLAQYSGRLALKGRTQVI